MAEEILIHLFSANVRGERILPQVCFDGVDHAAIIIGFKVGISWKCLTSTEGLVALYSASIFPLTLSFSLKNPRERFSHETACTNIKCFSFSLYNQASNVVFCFIITKFSEFCSWFC